MKFTSTLIDGAWIIDIDSLVDERGSFARLYDRDAFLAHGVDLPILQINFAVNDRRGTLRGLHYQASPHEEGKLIHCTVGAVYDVIVDLRAGSPSRGRWIGVDLTADNQRVVYAPPGCAHGYVSITDHAALLYHMSAAYTPGFGRGVRWNDPRLGVEWPIKPLLISDRDREWPDWGG
jgi:dTDP-4-dehydrorhamnose 3,5-epimerase